MKRELFGGNCWGINQIDNYMLLHTLLSEMEKN